tara:strand:- start:31 stop:1011 length:981 start_codon:yes stop_codon:yes gene_type:complete
VIKPNADPKVDMTETRPILKAVYYADGSDAALVEANHMLALAIEDATSTDADRRRAGAVVRWAKENECHPHKTLEFTAVYVMVVVVKNTRKPTTHKDVETLVTVLTSIGFKADKRNVKIALIKDRLRALQLMKESHRGASGSSPASSTPATSPSPRSSSSAASRSRASAKRSLEQDTEAESSPPKRSKQREQEEEEECTAPASATPPVPEDDGAEMITVPKALHEELLNKARRQQATDHIDELRSNFRRIKEHLKIVEKTEITLQQKQLAIEQSQLALQQKQLAIAEEQLAMQQLQRVNLDTLDEIREEMHRMCRVHEVDMSDDDE